MQIPWHLTWGRTNYTLIGIIFCDPTKGEEHFSCLIEINNKLYEHQLAKLDGLLRVVDIPFGAGTGFRLSDTVFCQSVPTRFFYLKDAEADGPSEWTPVIIQSRVFDFANDLSPIVVDSVSEFGKSDDPGEDESRNPNKRDVVVRPNLSYETRNSVNGSS
jgi:hypothetical protein